MRHIHLDLLGGLAGDMFLAMLLDAGLIDRDRLQEVLSRLGFGSIEVHVEKTRRGALAGSHLSFSGWDPSHDKTHRHLSTILEIIEAADLAPSVKKRAAAMFTVLGEAEAAVHGMALEKVHFHECGAMDSILDFIGAAWAIDHLGATWSMGPIPVGTGTTQTDHGVVPVPVPATVVLLRGIDVVPRDIEAEMVTPTGATIIKALHQEPLARRRPAGRCAAVGYGLGSRDLPGIANAVRCMLVEAAKNGHADAADSDPGAASRELESGYMSDEICRLSCDIDDMNPELLPLVEKTLYEQGALDVSRQALWMKKARQGTRLTVLCRLEDRDLLADLIFDGTSTFGLRVERIERLILRREVHRVETEWGTVAVKLGYRGDQLLRAVPELEDCARIAADAGVAVGDVYARAVEAARRRWM